MPTPFDVSAETSASVAQVFAAFNSTQYWLDRLAAYGGDSMTLDYLDVDADGVVSVSTTQHLGGDVLPGFLTKVLPGDLKMVRAETWRPADDERVTGEVLISASGVPGSGQGSAVLATAGQGSRLTLSGTLQVRIPLVGGRIEKFIGDQLVEQIPDVQRFTTQWIAEHG